MKSKMSVKEMVKLYLSYELENEVWEMLYRMACCNLISNENWKTFSDTCASWRFNEDGSKVMDDFLKVVAERDESGYLIEK